MFSFTTLSKFCLRVGLVSLTLWLGFRTSEASEPPLVEPSPLGELKNRRDAAVVIGNEIYYKSGFRSYLHHSVRRGPESASRLQRVVAKPKTWT